MPTEPVKVADFRAPTRKCLPKIIFDNPEGAHDKTSVRFGRFSLNLQRRELFADGISVTIGGRALDVLIALIEAAGQLVSKDEIFARVWPTTVVAENALQFQISQIRKVFGKDRNFIRTISGRGYRFAAEITTSPLGDCTPYRGPAAAIMSCGGTPVHTNLPAPTSDLIGREAQLSEVADLMSMHRLITLAGAGGIGKSRLGIELGRYLLPKLKDGVWLVELAELSGPELVLPTIAHTIGVAAGPDLLERLSVSLRPKHLLLVLDGCEHVIDAVARAAEALLRASPALHVVATSREPLRVHGECVYRVPALDVPAEDFGDIEHARRCGAVRLFVARACMEEPHFALDTRSASAVVKICRYLEGVPLGIELAAARAATLGIEELATRMNDCCGLLSGGRRTALARHRSLRATLDWSYDLLSEPERLVMRRIAVFAAGFTLPAAYAVVDTSTDGSEITDWLHGLIAKSLVATDLRGAVPYYRLSSVTRAYAREKLRESGEFSTVARRHAEYFRDLLEWAERGRETRSMIEQLAAHSALIDDVQIAVEWAYSPGGDPAIGTALEAASTRDWRALCDACRARVEFPISGPQSGSPEAARREVQLANVAEVGRVVYLANHPHLGENAARVYPDAQIHRLGPVPPALR